MRQAIEVLNGMVEEGKLRSYAIGGGVAATFYMEPVLTYDLDVFLLLPPAEGILVDLTALYRDLGDRGFPAEHEHVLIGGLPVQLIPAYNPLIEEAVLQAVELAFEDAMVRVVRPEHLLAIMVQTGRPKDRHRVALFLEQADWDRDRLMDILRRHGLEDRFRGSGGGGAS
ncbi:MAG: hypothetical protein FJ098_04025 [Deltaproteobacteria bacterium]|nr:hypothetical protein [Deltaproteobacteria bacterium]